MLLAQLTERQRLEITIYAHYHAIEGVSRPAEGATDEEMADPASRLAMVARTLGAKVD